MRGWQLRSDRRLWRALALMSLLTLPLALTPGPARASAKPPTSWSFYVDGNNPSLLDSLGCNQANHDRTYSAHSMVILDFGGLNPDGTQHKLFNGVWYPQSTIVNLAESFINGYTRCNPGNGSLILVVGTNNSLYFNATNGTAFANTVKSVSNYATAVTTKVMVWGGADIETWSRFDIYSNQVYDWYSGYSSTGGPLYVDYGSADGCDQTNWVCYAANNSNFNKGDYYNFAWGWTLAEGTPEVYYEVNASQWYWIEQATRPMYLEGPLNTTQGLTSDQAWQDLNAYFPSISYSLCIKFASQSTNCP